MMSAARKNNVWFALLVSSIVFAYHHHFNGGFGPIAFANLFLLAVLLGMTVLLTNRIWAATAIHAAWNFFQGNVFGVAVSGAAPDPSRIVLATTLEGNSCLTGGAMGLEGSLVATVVLILACASLLLLMLKRRGVVRKQSR